MQRHPRVCGKVLLAVLAGLALISVPGAAHANPLTPASPQARLQADLFWITIAIAGLVFIAVEFLIVYTALRFRRRGTRVTEPAQIHGNTRLEIMWTILPGVILVSLFIVSVRSMGEIGNVPADAQVVKVTGRQFSWQFQYPEANVTTTNDLRIPVGQPIVLEITSADVIHSFWVPDLGGKIDANPGLINRLNVTADREGVFRGVCTELCGVGHASMLFSVTAMQPADYQAWLSQGGQVAAQQAAQAAAGPSPELGKQLVAGKGACGACHEIAGVPGMVGKIGPSLTKIGSVAAQRKPSVDAQAYLTESIVNPNAFVVQGFQPIMPPKGGVDLSDQEIAALVAYLQTLK